MVSDRSAWLKFGNKAGLAILVEGVKRLFNKYGVILANKDRHPQYQCGTGPNVHCNVSPTISFQRRQA